MQTPYASKAPRRLLLLISCGALLVVASYSGSAEEVNAVASGSQQATDGLTVTPEIFTPASSGNGSSTSTTLGLDYSYKKTFQIFGTPIPQQLSSSVIRVGNAQISTTGKIPADHNANVGDLLDLSGLMGLEWYWLPLAPAPGTQETPQRTWAGDITLNAKVSLEEGPHLSTTLYTYGASLFASLQGAAGPQAQAYITWPSFLFEFARVDPSNDSARKAVEPNLSNYNRLHERVGGGIKLPVTLKGRDIKFDAKYDHWHEVSPPDSIATAHLSAQTYRAYSILLPGSKSDPDWTVTYSTGNVPTDQAAAKVWSLGWSWKFE